MPTMARVALTPVAILTLTVLLMARPIWAAEQPRTVSTGLDPVSYVGWEADRTTGRSVCDIASLDVCQSHKRSTTAGGFDYPYAVATDPRTGEVYVAEVEANRIQKLTADGAFVAMFGGDVNEAGGKRAPAGEANLCTAVSWHACGPGTAGTAPGQLDSPASVAVDPASGDVYVLEIGVGDFRVDKLTSDGHFLWRIGKDVNRTKGVNLCTAHEIERVLAKCGPGRPNPSSSTEHGAFKFANQSGDLLAVDGRRRLLYVGDEHRVQVFATDGRWREELSLASISAEPDSSVVALTLDAKGNLYVVYRVGAVETYRPSEQANVVHVLDTNGEQVAEYSVTAEQAGAVDSIDGIAMDSSGRLAIMGVEAGGESSSGRLGLLYDVRKSAQPRRFPTPPDNDGIAFGPQGRLYVATAVDEEVVIYAPAVCLLVSLTCEGELR